MSTTLSNQQDDRDQKLLLRLLLLPVKRPSRTRAFFSSAIWQSVGPIVSFVTLLVTIYLTYSIANITREQNTAHMSAATHGHPGPSGPIMPVPMPTKPYQPTTPREEPEPEPPTEVAPAPDEIVSIENRGPATGQGVRVVITAERAAIKCQMDDRVVSPAMMRPSRIDNKATSCEIYYDYFYPNKTSDIAVFYVQTKSDGTTNSGPPVPAPISSSPYDPSVEPFHYDISGVNIAVP